jgi:fibronectin type 3 domain-containing protein
VGLSWDASTSASISGYNVYRGSSQSGPFSRLNGSLVSGLDYTDGTVVGGDTYYYVTTAVDSHGDESPYSNWAKAVIPE